jgi:starch synthase
VDATPISEEAVEPVVSPAAAGATSGLVVEVPSPDFALPTSSQSGPVRSILMVASEAVPYSKTGGLGDVAAALPRALGRLGHRVTVVTPRYRGVAVSGEPRLELDLQLGRDSYRVSVFDESIGPNARAWLVDIPVFFDRDGYYGTGGHDHPDNPLRFAALARAAFEAAIAAGFQPDIVHAHDWQGGLAPVYLKTLYRDHPVMSGVPAIFTIHNVAYKGLCDPTWLREVDLGLDLLHPGALEYWGLVSYLKAGINFSERITTVSRRHADELLTPEFAFGFEGILAARRADLVGILNGIDTEVWDPAADRYIPRRYDRDDLTGKREAKRALLAAYNLPSDDKAVDVPLVGMVSRMIEQKGVDLIAQASADLPTLGARFVILGTGEPRYEAMWQRLAAAYPDRIAVKVGFDEALSHLVEAGADLFLMPSRFEPCGLNQMYSLRYGTLPLVRATGGLDDTVENFDPFALTGNGFKFWEPSGAALANTLRWALRVYENKEVWRALQRRAMSGDFSWNRSAQQYVAVYEDALASVGRGGRAPGLARSVDG